MSVPRCAESSDSVTAGFSAMFRSFRVPADVYSRTTGSSHRNHTGTWCGRPSGRVLPNQITGSEARRVAMCSSSLRRRSSSGVATRATVPFRPMDRCGECGYVYDTPRDDIGPALRAGAADHAERLAGTDSGDLRARTVDGTWSPLEYACHVRDVLLEQDLRIGRTQTEDEPAFAQMGGGVGREALVVDRRYNQQAPATVASELEQAAAALADRLDTLDPAGWGRTGIYNFPEPRPRTAEWIACHTIHEVRHHLLDVDRLLGRVTP